MAGWKLMTGRLPAGRLHARAGNFFGEGFSLMETFSIHLSIGRLPAMEILYLYVGNFSGEAHLQETLSFMSCLLLLPSSGHT